MKNTAVNLLSLLTPDIPQRKSSTKKQRHASSKYLALQIPHYYMKCRIYQVWALDIHCKYGWVLDQSIFPPFLLWCMRAVSWLLGEDSGFILRIRYQAATQQLAEGMTISQSSNLSTALQAKDFSFSSNWNFLGNLQSKRTSGTEGCIYTASSASNLLTVHPFWGTCNSNISWILAATDIAFEDCILPLLGFLWDFCDCSRFFKMPLNPF